MAEIDNSQYITRKEIQELTGASEAKVFIVSNSKKWGFPRPVARGNRRQAYPRKEVLEWIEANDLKNMVLKQRNTAVQVDTEVVKNKKFDNDLVTSFLTNIAPTVTFLKKGQSVNKHVPATDAWDEPYLEQLPSHRSGSEHRLVIEGGF
jgi:predicted DNA-binding transcriptional regulator AlpA